MKQPVKVFSSMSAGHAELVRAGLESAGLRAFIFGGDVATLAGGVPFVEADVAVFVGPDDAEAAQQIVASMEGERADRADQPAWTCPTCGETIDAIFTECWNCTAEE